MEIYLLAYAKQSKNNNIILLVCKQKVIRTLSHLSKNAPSYFTLFNENHAKATKAAKALLEVLNNEEKPDSLLPHHTMLETNELKEVYDFVASSQIWQEENLAYAGSK